MHAKAKKDSSTEECTRGPLEAQWLEFRDHAVKNLNEEPLPKVMEELFWAGAMALAVELKHAKDGSVLILDELNAYRKKMVEKYLAWGAKWPVQ